MFKDESFGNESYRKLVRSLEWVKKWSTYCKWQEFQKIQIHDKFGNIKNLTMRFENYLIYRENDYLRYLIIKESDSIAFGDFKAKGKAKHSKQREIIHDMMNTVTLIDRTSETAEEFKSFKINEGSEDYQSLAPNEMSSVERYQGRKLKFDIFPSKKSRVEQLKYSKNSKKKIEKQGSIRQTNGQDNSSIAAENGERLNQIFKKKQKLINEKNDKRSDSGASVAMVRERTGLMSRFIHSRLNPKKIHFSVMIIISILLFIIVSNAFITSLNAPLFKDIMSDINENIMICDYSSLEIWTAVQAMMMTDIARAAREGWFDPKISTKLRGGEDETLFKYTHIQKSLSGGAQLDIEDEVDIRMRKLKFKQLFNYSGWVNNEINLEVYKDFGKDLNTHKFVNITLPRRAAIQYIQGLSSKVYLRDYENSTEIVNFGTPENRFKDRDEAQYRRLLLGDFNKEYVLMNYDLHNYFKSLIMYSKERNYRNYFATIGISCLLFVVYFWYGIMRVKKIREFYQRLFKLKASF